MIYGDGTSITYTYNQRWNCTTKVYSNGLSEYCSYDNAGKFGVLSQTVTVKKAATVKKAIKGLKAKKTYYVRIRSYKTVKKVNYYSKWSKVVKCKAK